MLLNERNILNDGNCLQSLFFDYQTNQSILLDTAKCEVSIQIKDEENNLLASDNGFSMVDRIEFQIKEKSKNEMIENLGHISFYIESNSLRFKYGRNKKMDSLDDVEFIFNLKNKRYQDRFIKDISTILQSKSQEQNLQKNIYKFFTNIETIKFVANNNLAVRQKHLKHDIDFRLLGQGFQTYIFILVAILSKKKYILIDEIENGLHFKSIDLILESILQSPKDTQFFITTHNEEILQRLALKLEK